MTRLIGFSGQGSQYPGMFNRLKEDAFGQAWLKEASHLLGLNLLDEKTIGKYCYDVLYSQLFITLLSVGTFRSVQSSFSSKLIFCGYSLGEISAFCTSAQVPLDKIVQLIEQRVKIMQESLEESVQDQPAGLIVLKGNINRVKALALANQFQCYIAIIINIDHYVIGGLNVNINLLAKEAQSMGVLKTEILPIKLPSHTPILKTATDKFLLYLQTQYKDYVMHYTILNALTVNMISSTPDMLNILATELSSTLHWGKLMRIAAEYGTDLFIEFGPKSSLKNMFVSVYPTLRAYAMDEFITVAALKTLA